MAEKKTNNTNTKKKTTSTTKKTTTKSPSTKAASATTEDVNAKTLELLAQMQAKIESLEGELRDARRTNVENQIMYENSKKSLDDEITIIYNDFGTLRAQFPSWKLTLSNFGQRYTMTRRQFQELVNNKRAYFDAAYILLAPEYMKEAEENGVGVYNPNSKEFIKPEDIKKFASMTPRDIEDYYEGLSDNMKNAFVTYFMGKCYDKDINFFSVDKMNTLNRLTGTRLFDNLISVCANSQN